MKLKASESNCKFLITSSVTGNTLGMIDELMKCQLAWRHAAVTPDGVTTAGQTAEGRTEQMMARRVKPGMVGTRS